MALGEAGLGGDDRAAGEGEAGACAAGDAAGDAPLDGGEPAGAGEARAGLAPAPAVACVSGGVAIGPAGAGFCFAKSVTVNSMARSIGTRATPLFLSIQPYIVKALSASSRNVFKFSRRFFARVSS